MRSVLVKETLLINISLSRINTLSEPYKMVQTTIPSVTCSYALREKNQVSSRQVRFAYLYKNSNVEIFVIAHHNNDMQIKSFLVFWFVGLPKFKEFAPLSLQWLFASKFSWEFELDSKVPQDRINPKSTTAFKEALTCSWSLLTSKYCIYMQLLVMAMFWFNWKQEKKRIDTTSSRLVTRGELFSIHKESLQLCCLIKGIYPKAEGLH